MGVSNRRRGGQTLMAHVVGLTLVAGCNAGGDKAATSAGTNTAETTGTDTATTSAGTVVINSLQDSYPRGLAVDALQPVVTEAVKAEQLASPSGTVTVAGLTEEPAAGGPKSLADDLVEQDRLLSGEGDCLEGRILQPAVTNPPSGNTCFSDGQLRSASGGENEPQTESCVVITSRREIDRARDLVETATRLSLGMLCQVKKSGEKAELPAVGATLDLKAALSAAVEGRAKEPQVLVAAITRLPDDGGFPVYRTDVKVTIRMIDGGGMDRGLVTKEMHLVHSPEGGEANNYHGVIWMTQSFGEAKLNAPTWLGVSYIKTGTVAEPRLKFEVRKFEWAGQADPVGTDGLLDLSKGAVFNVPANDPGYGMWTGMSDHNSVIRTIRYLNFDINPLDGAGSVGVWLNDGNYNTAARGLVTTFKRGDSGRFEGCGVAGAATQGLSVRRSLHEEKPLLLPAGRYFQTLNGAEVPTGQYSLCNGGNCVGESDTQVYVQCFAQAADGSFGIVEEDGEKVHLLPAAQAAAKYAIVSPDLAEVVRFTGDVRPD